MLSIEYETLSIKHRISRIDDLVYNIGHIIEKHRASSMIFSDELVNSQGADVNKRSLIIYS